MDTADLSDGIRLRDDEPFELAVDAGQVEPVLCSLVAGEPERA
ncbi:MAG TPA: hypothetical protein VGO60_01395 [Iamia sp.]|nr:hypothetical protein [Iamia sp.]